MTDNNDEQFLSDEVTSVAPARFFPGKTPRDTLPSSADVDTDDFHFPIVRHASGTVHSIPTAVRQRIEECYDLLKNGGFFDGPRYAAEGIGKEIASYIRGSSGWTFLHQAAFHQHESAVTFLIKNGADRTIRGRFDGKTAYDVALTNGKNKGDPKVLEMLEVKKAPHVGGLVSGHGR